MADPIALIYDTTFWLIINIILIAAILGLAYKQYYAANRRREERGEDEVVSLQSEIDLFRRLAESGERDKAIITTFGAVMSRLMGGGYRSKTYLELLDENPARLDKESIASLKRMYGIYEMVRFGEVQPDEGMLNFFGDELLKLKAHLTTLKGVKISA